MKLKPLVNRGAVTGWGCHRGSSDSAQRSQCAQSEAAWASGFAPESPYLEHLGIVPAARLGGALTPFSSA